MNIHDPSQKIFIIDDGCKSLAECPSYEDYQIYKELCLRFANEDDDDDEDGSDNSDSDNMEGDGKLVEKTGMIDEEEEADLVKKMQEGGDINISAAAGAASGATVGAMGEDFEGTGKRVVGAAEAQAAFKHMEEVKEAEQELADLKDSDDEEVDDGEEVMYKGLKGQVAEGS